MSGIAPRDPQADTRGTRRAFITLGALAVAALVVAAAILVASREPDLTYTFQLTFTERGGHPYTLVLPLPSDEGLSSLCRYLGNGTAVREPSTYGPALRVQGVGDVALSCLMKSFDLKPLSFSTEGSSARGADAVRLLLNSSGSALEPKLNLSFREAGKQWTTTRYAQGDLSEGWNTVEVREVLQPTPAYSAPPPT